jgi:hypothetical protein
MQSWNHRVLRHEFALGLILATLPLLAWGWLWFTNTSHRTSGAWAIAWATAIFLLLRMWCRWQRERQVREAPMPQFLKRKLRETYPHLSGKDCDLVERGLRQFFIACLRSNKKFVAMPSRVVDAMWHEFILHTKAYQDWCELALGWFLHHTPAEVLGAKARNNDGLRRAWYWACRDEAIAPKAPTRLPLLFALDGKLQIENGFHYVPNCQDIQRKSDAGGDGAASYCGTDFSDESFSGAADSFGGADASDSSSDAGGDGGSDGGGDGGGCGGGGD